VIILNDSDVLEKFIALKNLNLDAVVNIDKIAVNTL